MRTVYFEIADFLDSCLEWLDEQSAAATKSDGIFAKIHLAFVIFGLATIGCISVALDVFAPD